MSEEQYEIYLKSISDVDDLIGPLDWDDWLSENDDEDDLHI